MADSTRKPPVRMEPTMPILESTEPHSIRFTPTQWLAIREEARRRGEEPSRLVRRLTLHALSMLRQQQAAREHAEMLGAGSL